MARMIAATRFHGYAMTFKCTRTLTDKQKTYLVTRLAADDAPAEIADGLKEEFGVDITPRSVARYHPGMARGHKLSAPLQALFWEARKSYILTNDEILSMDILMRIGLQERVVLEAWAARQYRIANDILDAIAGECGDYKRAFGHEPSGPSPLKFH
jgi:hypothetical protein